MQQEHKKRLVQDATNLEGNFANKRNLKNFIANIA
jgi:hypothetical protein